MIDMVGLYLLLLFFSSFVCHEFSFTDLIGTHLIFDVPVSHAHKSRYQSGPALELVAEPANLGGVSG